MNASRTQVVPTTACDAIARSLHLTRLPAYLAAGVGVASLAPSAEAAIVVIDLTNVSGNNISGVNAGLNGSSRTINNWLGAGTGSLQLFQNASISSGNGTGIAASGNLQIANGGGYANPYNFISLQVGPYDSFGGSRENSLFRYTSSIYYPPVSYLALSFGTGSGYLGFRFASASNYNYGWLQVTWDAANDRFQILSGAYENSVNTAITAGDTGSPSPSSVPDSGSTGLLSLVLGGAALHQWRRNRRPGVAPAATA